MFSGVLLSKGIFFSHLFLRVIRDSSLRFVKKRTYLEPMWFSMRYQVAEKFSLVKSPLIPGNVSSMSFCGSLPLKEER